MFGTFVALSVVVATAWGQSTAEGKGIQEGTGWFESRVEYTLNFTWPIAEFFNLPSSGAHWSYASQQFAAIPTGLRWKFSLYSPGNNTEGGKVYLAIKLETLPKRFEYFLGSAQCGLLDVNDDFKYVERTGKNALLPTLNLRFDPLVHFNTLIQDAVNLIKDPNGTLTLKCQLKGDLKEDLMKLDISPAGVVSRYPSKIVEQGDTSNLEDNGDFTMNFTFGIENFEEWPLSYAKGDVTFNRVEANLEGAFDYQFRTYNPSSNFYPVYLWVESMPRGRSTFFGTCSCGVIDNRKNKVPGETVVMLEAFPSYFFTFSRAASCEQVENRKSKVMPDGVLRFYCDLQGVMTLYPKIKRSG